MRRARPVLVLAAAAFATGAILGADHGNPPGYAVAQRFVTAWTRRDYAGMYSDIARSSQRAISLGEFTDAYRQALTTATLTSAKTMGAPSAGASGAVEVPGARPTRACSARSRSTSCCRPSRTRRAARGSRGRAHSPFRACVPARRSAATPTSHDARRCSLATAACWPKAARVPTRHSRAKSHAARRSASAAEAVVGTVGPAPAARRQELEAQGVPADASVGLSGLELAFDDRLRGMAGGRLLAGARVLAAALPVPGADRAHHDLAGGAARGRRCARRAVRRNRRTAPVQRTDPGGRRHRPQRTAAARLDVQDDHHHRGARGEAGHPPHRLSLRDLRDARRREAEQRERRGMRRLAGTRVRRLVQLGVHAAGSQARRQPAGRDRGTLRLQPPVRDSRRLGKHAAARQRDPGRTRRRLDRDRPGAGARHATGDGDRGGDDRRRRPPTRADLPAGARRRACERDERFGGSHHAPPDDRCRSRRHRHRRRDPRDNGRRQDRHGRTEEHGRTQEQLRHHGPGIQLERSRGQRRLSASRKRSRQHRRLVRRVRAGAAPARRGRGAARQRRRRRRHRGAGRPRSARGGTRRTLQAVTSAERTSTRRRARRRPFPSGFQGRRF